MCIFFWLIKFSSSGLIAFAKKSLREHEEVVSGLIMDGYFSVVSLLEKADSKSLL